MKVGTGAFAIALLLLVSANLRAQDHALKKGDLVFLAADELTVAEEESLPPDRLTRGDTLKFVRRKQDEALVSFAGDSRYAVVFGTKTLVGNEKPVPRETWVPLAKLARTHEEAIAAPGEKPAPAAKLTAEEWRAKLRGTWREWGWELHGRRHRFADPNPVRTKEGQALPNPLGLYFWRFDEKGAKQFDPAPNGFEKVYTDLQIDATDSPAILDLFFVHSPHTYAHRYGLEAEGSLVRLAFYGSEVGVSVDDVQKKLIKMRNLKRTWTQSGEPLNVTLLERVEEKQDASGTKK
jgi:hypothetical protein